MIKKTIYEGAFYILLLFFIHIALSYMEDFDFMANLFESKYRCGAYYLTKGCLTFLYVVSIGTILSERKL